MCCNVALKQPDEAENNISGSWIAFVQCQYTALLGLSQYVARRNRTRKMPCFGSKHLYAYPCLGARKFLLVLNRTESYLSYHAAAEDDVEDSL